uniref:Uncharacterized protein n=1 Tax=Arundo donax TaxID=35708 RepID=A0A0A9GTX1_ARUDO
MTSYSSQIPQGASPNKWQEQLGQQRRWKTPTHIMSISSCVPGSLSMGELSAQ